MNKKLAVVAAIFAAALVATGNAEAGASASAASKYSNASHLASYQMRTNGQARRTDFAITEYSSSSARSTTHKH